MQNDIPPSTISIHDNTLYACIVDCENRKIILYTHFLTDSRTEYTDVIFTGVIAHQFKHVLSSNILFDINEIPVSDIVNNAADLFAAGKNHCWPDGIEYEDPEGLIRILEGRGARGFEISSSYGMSGWVIAKVMELNLVEGSAISDRQ